MDLIGRDGVGFARWHPTIPSTQHAEKPRPTFIHDFATNRKRILLRGHAPTQVHIHEMNSPLQQFLPQSWKHKANKMIPLRLHVAER